MKLYEVIDVRAAPERSPEHLSQYHQRLQKKHKMKTVGSGAYAVVYQHPQHTTMVVKVAEQGQDALAWLSFVANNQNNPYVPKIYDVKRFQSNRAKQTGHWLADSTHYYVVFMEKLSSYDKLSDEAKEIVLFQHFGPIVNKWTERHTVDNLFNVIIGDPRFIRGMKTQSRRSGVPSPALVQVMDVLDRMKYLDVHDQNVMMRGKQLVFVDPVE
jgi:hypothetical protein